MFRNIPDAEAEATVDAAWQQGTRYFDTAPFYGAGLSEIRLGKALAKHKRDQYRLSTKVGRIVLDEIDTQARNFGEKGDLFKFGRPNKIVYDYTEKGAMKSVEDSLKRLGVDRLDFVWIHDVARDFHGDEWVAQFETARKGAFRALDRLREQGAIRAWGLGTNRVEPCELAVDMTEIRPNALLLAGRYSLLDHEQAGFWGPRSSRTPLPAAVVFPSNQFSVPSQQRFGHTLSHGPTLETRRQWRTGS